MATEITGTETVAGNLRTITLGGSKFRVPFTPTIRYMFWMRGFLKRFAEEQITDDDVVECYEQLVAFLRRYNRAVDEDALQDLELAEVIGFYTRCFSGQEEDEEGERPTRATRGGASSRTRSARSRS